MANENQPDIDGTTLYRRSLLRLRFPATNADGAMEGRYASKRGLLTGAIFFSVVGVAAIKRQGSIAWNG